MTRVAVAGALAVLLGTNAVAQDIPESVRYQSASAATNARAEALLDKALLSEPYRVARLQGNARSSPLLVGPFLSGALIQSGAAKRDDFLKGKYEIALSADVRPEMPAIGAENATQRATLDAALTHAIPRGGNSHVIRKMRPSEMALIWFYIGWDITEPVFAVELGGRTLVVDFDEAGESVTWLEDISQPCFRVTWDGGGLLPCYCSTTVQQGNRYSVVFQPQEGDTSCAPANEPQ